MGQAVVATAKLLGLGLGARGLCRPKGAACRRGRLGAEDGSLVRLLEWFQMASALKDV